MTATSTLTPGRKEASMELRRCECCGGLYRSADPKLCPYCALGKES